MLTQRLKYLLLRLMIAPFGYLPYPAIHFLGRQLGTLAFYLLKDFRKRTLSNLALANALRLSQSQIRSFAKQSFQNLMITCLEYPKFAKEQDISKIATCENPEKAIELLSEGKGIIFFCGHQANWEILFLEGTSRMPGVAIGRPVKNSYLYDWILSIRQKFGGTIITPKNAIKEGLRALKQGKFLGIVGDQGMPDSGYSSPFMGRTAWTSPIPAMLSYRTERPILVAMTTRKNGKYHIRYSDPIWPDVSQPMESEIDRLMKASLGILEESIKAYPDQWLWQHNRWKQQLPGKLKRPYRQESLCIIAGSDEKQTQDLLSHIPLFRQFYPKEFITLFLPRALKDLAPKDQEITSILYDSDQELFKPYYQYKVVFNFSQNQKLSRHYKKLSAFAIVDHLDPSAPSFPQILTHTLSNAL